MDIQKADDLSRQGIFPSNLDTPIWETGGKLSRR
jgi:hypothetical protein